MIKRSLVVVLVLFNVLSANEKIYAIMITGKDAFHKELAKRSIQSFLEQTYVNKHLIIVNDGSYTFSDLEGELITEVRPKKKMTLGSLRNVGLRAIPNKAIWIQWDDDDWHHPSIIEDQYKFMKSSKAFAVLLRQQVQYNSLRNSGWIDGGKHGIPGTIMMRKIKGFYYPSTKKGEDDEFLTNLRKIKKVRIWNNPPYYYLRFIHGKNTWGADHFKSNAFKVNTFTMPQTSKEYLQKIVKQHYGSIFGI